MLDAHCCQTWAHWEKNEAPCWEQSNTLNPLLLKQRKLWWSWIFSCLLTVRNVRIITPVVMNINETEFKWQYNLNIVKSFRSVLIYKQRPFIAQQPGLSTTLYLSKLFSNIFNFSFLQPRRHREAFRPLEAVVEVWWWGPGWRTSPLAPTQPYCPSPVERSSTCWSNSPGTAGCTDMQRAARGVTRSAGTVFVFEWMWKKKNIYAQFTKKSVWSCKTKNNSSYQYFINNYCIKLKSIWWI